MGLFCWFVDKIGGLVVWVLMKESGERLTVGGSVSGVMLTNFCARVCLMELTWRTRGCETMRWCSKAW